MDSRLTWALCDKQGVQIASLADRLASNVSLGINDIRNGTVTVSLEDPAVAALSSMDTRLKAWLGERIILNAPVFLPHYEGSVGQEGTVQISATDNVQLAAAFTAGFPVQTNVDQGGIMLALAAHASAPHVLDPVSPIPLAGGGGVPGNGIIAGSIPATQTRTRTWFDGNNIWDLIVELAGIEGGVDFELEPLDRTDGIFMQLNTFNRRRGTDRSADVVFEVGTGRDNATAWSWEPSGEQMVNYYVLVSGSQVVTRYNQATAALVQHAASQQQFGLYQAFEIDSNVDEGGATLTQLTARARQAVAARAYPIDFFTVTPAVEQDGAVVGWARDETGELIQVGQGYGVPPRFAPDGDYWLGDTISVIVKEGEMQGSFPGRVSSVNIVETDEAGNVACELVCTPKDRASSGVTDTQGFVVLGAADQLSVDSSVDTSEPQEPDSTPPKKKHHKKKHKHPHHHRHHHKKHR